MNAEVCDPAKQMDVPGRGIASDPQLVCCKDGFCGSRRAGDQAQPAATFFGQSIDEDGPVGREDPLLKPDAPWKARPLTTVQYLAFPEA